MNEKAKTANYDLEERTLEFARNVRSFVKPLPKTELTIEDMKQLVRSSGSIGANYIEANEALSKKDFLNRIKICRKEAKETAYWLKLVETNGPGNDKIRLSLLQEAAELTNIFGAIYRKSQ
ncbi:MAG: four helix bundle protein [Desulfobacterales bacterium]